MKQDIKQTWFFGQPVQQVWDYLTKPELLEQWLMKNDFKPIVGHKFQFLSTKDLGKKAITHCEVLEIIPHKLLSYSWTSCTGKTIDSLVTWTLAEKDGGTELQLHHNGFTLLEEFTSHTNGWSSFLKGFTQHLNTVADVNSNT